MKISRGCEYACVFASRPPTPTNKRYDLVPWSNPVRAAGPLPEVISFNYQVSILKVRRTARMSPGTGAP